MAHVIPPTPPIDAAAPVAVVEPLGDEQFEVTWEVDWLPHPITTGPLQDALTHEAAEGARDAIQRVLNEGPDGTDPSRAFDVMAAAGVK